MSDAVSVIERVLPAGVLFPELTVVPPRGATPQEISDEEALLGRPLSTGLRRVLARWNGLNLDIIRIYGCGDVAEGVERLGENQIPPSEIPEIRGPIVFGSDPAGFVYIEDEKFSVWRLDTDGGDRVRVADGFDLFVASNVFGAGAEVFAGSDWASELRAAKLID